MKTMMNIAGSCAGLLILALAAGPASAEMMKFKAAMDGKSEVPPTNSMATGEADIEVDSATRQMKWVIGFKDLTGPPTAAHFHGPADPGASAPPEVDISGNLNTGSAQLTEAQMADLQAGKLYLNIHTEKFPDGEIRGQVTK